jgi:uncharacterized protein (DUF58 family)
LIYPARPAIAAAAAVAPVALLIGVLIPAYWFAGLSLLAFLLALCVIDAFAGARHRDAELICEGPAAVSVGAEFEVECHVRFARAAPSRCEVAVGSHPLLEAPGGHCRTVRIRDGVGAASVEMRAVRRGAASIGQTWLRWTGPLGLIWKQKEMSLGAEILIAPDIRAVRERSAQLLHRQAMHGLIAQLELGEGAEFEALADYRQGMDRRAIDWKSSARHTSLLAKEYRTERNNNIIIALDAGRTMCEPLAGVPRVDRAVSAALLTAFVALKDGDRVSLFGFDSHPRVATKPVSGSRSFALLQRVAAGIDYSDRETNYTLALATLASGLHRRSLVVIFTDFADTISAELMLSAVGTLLSRHLVLFILFRDEELESLVETEPVEPEDVTRAVTAAALLRERKLVVNRLRRLGVHVLEAKHDQAGPTLVNAYVDFKRRNLL